MFCNNCGNQIPEDARFCNSCGSVPSAQPQAHEQMTEQPPAQQQQLYAPPPVAPSQAAQPVEYYTPHVQPYPQYAPAPAAPVQIVPSEFLNRLRLHASSPLFLVGCILFSAGTLGGFLFGFSVWSVFAFLLAALPIVGLWLLYGSSVSNSNVGVTRGALVCLKVKAIFDLVIFCIVLGVIALVGIASIVGGGALVAYLGGGGEFLAIGILLFLATLGVLVVVLVLYFVAWVKAINCIRAGVNVGNVREIKGASSFAVLSFIGLFFTTLFNSFSLTTHFVQFGFIREFNDFFNYFARELVADMPRDVQADMHRSLVDVFPSFGMGSPMPIAFSLLASAGLVVLLVKLLQFSGSIKNNPV